ncbi:hypothetical protein BGX21_005733 [Mortierella sp. AD011]|nr:hypothetical protein BGX21_005733 [Mortierella sp. AD011]
MAEGSSYHNPNSLDAKTQNKASKSACPSSTVLSAIHKSPFIQQFGLKKHGWPAQASIVSPTSPPAVLVQDSEDEAEINVNTPINYRPIGGDDEGSLVLSCVGAYVGVFDPSLGSPAGETRRDRQADSITSIQNPSNEVPDSEDEGHIARYLGTLKQTPSRVKVNDDLQSTSYVSALSNHQQPFFDLAFEPLNLIDEEQANIAAEVDLAANSRALQDKTNQQESPDKLELSSVKQIQQHSIVVRSYPLRERTFQQRKPYTADKQHHARLIGSRGTSTRSMQSRESILGDLAFIGQQDDEEDADYEEPAPNNFNEDIPVLPSRETLSERDTPNTDFFLQDLDDDDLPTIEDLRRQFQSRKGTKVFPLEINNSSHNAPQVKLLPSLSARAKRKLERLALHPLEALDPVDIDPVTPYTKDSPLVDSGFSIDNHNNSQSQFSEVSLYVSETSTSSHVNESNTEDNRGVSGNNSAYSSVLTKKPKRPRQHVLPMAFFKRNLLPDDAVALKSMRSRSSSSRIIEPGARPELDHAKLAHHAKRRIASPGQGDSLGDFMAQLGQDKSESESESRSSESSGISHQDVYELLQNDDGERRPTIGDTEPFEDHTLFPRYNRGYRKTVPRYSVSSDSDQAEIQSNEDSDSRLRSQDTGFTAFPIRPIKSTKVRGERLDMIDRMTVRSSNLSTSKQRSFIPSSRKRRRLSGNLKSARIRQSAFRSSKTLPEDSTVPARTIDLELDSDSSGELEFQHDLHGIIRKRLVGNSNPGYYFNEHRNAHKSDDYSVDYDNIDEEPSSFLNHRSLRSTIDLEYPILRYDATTSRSRPRSLSRPKVNPITRKLKLTRSSPTSKRPNHDQSRQRTPKKQLQQTLYPHLVSQNPHNARPQLVNRPTFMSSSRRSESNLTQDQELCSNPQYDTEGHWASQASMDDYTLMDQEQGPLPEREPATLPVLESLDRERPVTGPHNTTFAMDVRATVISNDSIPNGLYFSRDTYIGRGLLSQLLRVMSTQSCGKATASGYISSAVFFDQHFLPDWSDISCVERDLGAIIFEWKRRLRLIQESLSAHGPSNFRGGLHLPTEITTNLLALENMTLVLMECLTASPLECAALWRVFGSAVVAPLEQLTEELLSEEGYSTMLTLLLWMRWAIVTWKVLAACMMLAEKESIESAVQTLLRLLLEASGTGFVMQLSKLTSSTQVLQGAIHGQDVSEIWICLIQVLNRYSELHPPARGFWTSFNRQVLCIWLHDKEQVGIKGETSENSISTMRWHDRANHVMRLLRELCKLHQFGRDGSSNPVIQTSDNWELVLWLLQKNWLDGEQPESVEAETLLREFLTFCHSRIYHWGWTPCADVVVHIYRYFANRKFRDMPTEYGYRLPEFLKRMIATSSQHQEWFGPQHTNGLQPRTVFDFNVPLLETVQKHDRCFEIFLKVLVRTIHWQVCSIVVDGDLSSPYSASNVVSQADSMDGLSSEVAYQMLSRAEKIKACKRLLSSISPVVVTTISSASSSEQTYSSLCNPCNLVLTVALLVPDFIRPSTIGQLRSLLNFEESDDVSRRILLESVSYLGAIWQRQTEYGQASEKSARSLDMILDYVFGRLEFMCHALESDMNTTESNGANYVPRSKRQAPIAALIDTTLGYVIRLMCNEMNANHGRTPYPSVAYLDQRLSRFLDPEMGYSPELRLQALGVIEHFLTLRKSHESQLQKPLVRHSQPLVSVKLDDATAEQDQGKVVIDDGFSSLDYDQFDFDDNDFLESSQPNEINDTANSLADRYATAVPVTPHVPVILPQDDALAKVILSWVYPSLISLIKARHQALQEEQNQQMRSTIPVNLNHSPTALTSPFAPAQGIRRREYIPSDNSTSVRLSNISSMSPQGVCRVLGVYADCSMILLDLGRVNIDEVTELFKREPWLSPWIQHWRQQDELVWATHALESSPKSLLMHEDFFLNIWFRTISLPVHEITVQHRFLMAILSVLDSNISDPCQPQISSTMLCYHLFKDLPIAHRDYKKTCTKDGIHLTVEMNMDSTLLDTKKDADLLQEFKESRLQIIAKVLSNIGEHYLSIRPLAGSVDQAVFYRAQTAKSRYQSYLSLLMNQIKRDYERLEMRRMVRENIKHVEIAHHVVGHVIQHCGLVMQSSQLAGPHDSILNYLTSSRRFPQPRMDGAYIHQKIRGYAYLYQAGEKQFFYDMLGLILNHLKLIPGKNSLRFKWLERKQDHAKIIYSSCEPQDSLDNQGRLSEYLGLKVTDLGMTVYECDDGASTQTSKFPIRALFANQLIKQQNSHHRSNEALRTLTSSLRNVALEAEDRKQWNAVMSSFRTMVYIAIFRPLLTAFLRPEGYQGYCSSQLPAECGLATSRPATHSLPMRPSLMVISVPAVRWLVSLISALASDIDDLSSQVDVRPFPAARDSTMSLENSPALLALGGFQKETSMLFSSLLQCLIGCFDLIDTRWLEFIKTRLGDANPREDDMDRITDDNKSSLRALYLFGQVLQAIGAIAKAARKIQLEYSSFYEQNVSWREALLELIQLALDHSFFLMVSLGGHMEEKHDYTEEQIPSDNQTYSSFMNELGLDQPTAEDRIPGAQDIVSMEASFQEFLSGHTQFTQFEKQVNHELQNLSSVESWFGDVLSSGVGEEVKAPGTVRQQQGQYLDLEASQRLPKHHWVLWSFQSNFFDYCGSISALDGRFHRQVQRLLEKLLKSTLLGPFPKVVQNEGEDSVWYRILYNATDPSDGEMHNQPWTILRWCMSREWHLFQTEWSGYGSARNDGNLPRNYTPVVQDGDAQSMLLVMPGADSLFV